MFARHSVSLKVPIQSYNSSKAGPLGEDEQGGICEIAGDVFEAAHMGRRQLDVDWRRVGYSQGPGLAELSESGLRPVAGASSSSWSIRKRWLSLVYKLRSWAATYFDCLGGHMKQGPMSLPPQTSAISSFSST
jgi:hypothetical protein